MKSENFVSTTKTKEMNLSTQQKVFLGTTSVLVGTYLLQFQFGSKKKGHGLFDTEKYAENLRLISFSHFLLI
jgi:hypothetical protein